MPFPSPSLKEIIARTYADMESQLNLQSTDGLPNPVLRRSVLGVLAHVVGGSSYMLQGFLEYMARQVIVDTAESDFLQGWARVWGVNRKTAAFAQGSVLFKGSKGSIIPQGILLQRSDGIIFTVDQATTFQEDQVTVPVTATLAGQQSNTAAGTTLSLISPIQGICSDINVTVDGIQGGYNAEDDNGLRARLLKRIQTLPQGGALSDYEAWVMEVPGVKQAWIFPEYFGLGTVGVAFSLVGNDVVLPNLEKIQEVQVYLDERRPVTAEVIVFLPRLTPLDMTIKVTPLTSGVQQAITTELQALFRREAKPAAVIRLSQIHEALMLVNGIEDYVLVTPTATLHYSPHEIPQLGQVTWQLL
jgi:uncharacterized phage protein gp47/JayE